MTEPKGNYNTFYAIIALLENKKWRINYPNGLYSLENGKETYIPSAGGELYLQRCVDGIEENTSKELYEFEKHIMSLQHIEAALSGTSPDLLMT